MFAILLMTMVYIIDLPSMTAAENQIPSLTLESNPKNFNVVQEVPDNFIPFNGQATVKLERITQLNDYGILLMNDSYHLWNNQSDSTQFNYLNMSYPSELFEDASQYTFTGGQYNLSGISSNQADIAYQMFPNPNSDITDVRVFFPDSNSGFSDVSKNDELRLYISFAFDQRISVRRDNKDQRFTYNETLTPLLNFNAQFESEIRVPNVAGLKNETIEFILPNNQNFSYNSNYTTSSLELNIASVTLSDLNPIVGPLNEITDVNQLLPRVIFEYSSTRPLATVLENIRTVRIVSWGSLLITEQFLFQVQGAENIGTEGLYGLEKIQLTLPLNTSDFSGFDSVGNLTISDTSSSTHTTLDVNFRNQLKGDATYQFTISYRMPVEDYLTIDDDRLTLELPVASGFTWTIQEQTQRIILPEGSSIILPLNETLVEITDIPGNNAHMISFGTQDEQVFGNIVQRQVLTIKGQHLFEYHNGKITIVYRSSSFALLQIPLTIAIFLFILGALYIGIHRVRFEVSPTQAVEREIPVALLEAFVTTYDDKTAIEERLKRLNERLRRKRITRTSFQQENRVLDRELRRSETKVNTLKGQLRDESRRYRDMIEELEISETEKVSIINSGEELKGRRRKGQLSKDAFTRVQKEYQRRMQRTVNQIDKILVEMREEIELGSRT